MDLKELLGEELYAQVQKKLDEKNSAEPDKLKHVRYADLSEGNYVAKGKHDALMEQLAGKDTELATANQLIETLKKSTKDDTELQNKISTYETEKANLIAQLAETKLKSAIKVALISEGCKDVDYVTYKLNEKLKEKEKVLELDENDNIKGWDDMSKDIKTQLPSMFESQSSGSMKIEEKKLEEGQPRTAEPKDLASALEMKYESEAD